jgi:hypothetical protein
MEALPAMEAHPGVMEVHPGVMEAHPGVMEAHPGVMEANPGMMEANPGVMEANPGVMEAHPGVMEAHPVVMEAHPVVMEPHPGVMEVHLEPHSLSHGDFLVISQVAPRSQLSLCTLYEPFLSGPPPTCPVISQVDILSSLSVSFLNPDYSLSIIFLSGPPLPLPVLLFLMYAFSVLSLFPF